MKALMLFLMTSLSYSLLQLVEAEADTCPTLHEFIAMGPVVTNLKTQQPWVAQGACSSLDEFLMESPTYGNIAEVLADIMPASGTTLLLPLPLNDTSDDPPTIEELSAVLPNFIIPTQFKDAQAMLDAAQVESLANTTVMFTKQGDKLVAMFDGLRGASGIVVPLKFTVGKNVVFLLDQSTHYIPPDYANFTVADAELMPGLTLAEGQSCWRMTYGRGAGSPITDCDPDQEKNGALCYPRCRQGYYGVGPVCWASCQDGYTDDGALCRRNAHIYGKGCCCTIFGCCHNCDEGYTDDGCTCRKDVHIYAKDTYGRGAGTVLKCAPDLELNGALCYPRCRPGFHGNGPVCWADKSPTGYPFKCNDIAWATTQAGCNDVNGKFIAIGIDVGVALASCIGSIVVAAATLGTMADLVNEMCGDFAIGQLMEAASQGADLAGIPMCGE